MTEDAKSLYARLGGETLLEPAVNLLFDRVMGDPELRPFFAGVDLARLKACFRDFLVKILGGPLIYAVADMRAAHAHLSIRPAHFERVCDHLVDTLYGMGIEEETIGEVVSALEPVGSEIAHQNPGRRQ